MHGSDKFKNATPTYRCQKISNFYDFLLSGPRELRLGFLKFRVSDFFPENFNCTFNYWKASDPRVNRIEIWDSWGTSEIYKWITFGLEMFKVILGPLAI